MILFLLSNESDCAGFVLYVARTAFCRVLNLINVCILSAGYSFEGTVPALCKPIEVCDIKTKPIINVHVNICQFITIYLEAFIGLLIWSKGVWNPDYESVNNRRFLVNDKIESYNTVTTVYRIKMHEN